MVNGKSILLLFCVALLSIFSLQAQSFTTLTNDVQYRICRVGNSSRKVAERCYVRMSATAVTQKGQKVFSENCWLPIGEEPEKNSFVGSLMMLTQGDSAEFVMPARMFFSGMTDYQRAKGVSAKEPLNVYVRVLRVVESDIVLDDDYEKFCAEYFAYESSVIKNYRKSYPNYKPVGEVWKNQAKAGNGKKVSKSGDVMMITYEGRFLNGVQFDAGAKSDAPFRYVRGQQWQVVKGMAVALASMSEGEKASFIMPSKLAFGVKGLADIVPPFTPVIYEVEVVKVNAKR